MRKTICAVAAATLLSGLALGAAPASAASADTVRVPPTAYVMMMTPREKMMMKRKMMRRDMMMKRKMMKRKMMMKRNMM